MGLVVVSVLEEELEAESMMGGGGEGKKRTKIYLFIMV
jgi:hypothetical protein